jgi:hypothetical protein
MHLTDQFALLLSHPEQTGQSYHISEAIGASKS